MMAEEETILTSELFMMELQGTTDRDFTSSVLMYSGKICRICFGRRQHLTLSCPYLQSEAGFVEARNCNFNQLIHNYRHNQL